FSLPSKLTPFPYTTLFRSQITHFNIGIIRIFGFRPRLSSEFFLVPFSGAWRVSFALGCATPHYYLQFFIILQIVSCNAAGKLGRSEEHTSELQSLTNLVCP